MPAGTATDVAGNASAEVSCNYSVVYDWTGFLSPVDTGEVVNSVKGGRQVPVKFSLAGDQGLNVVAADSPTIEFGPCSAGRRGCHRADGDCRRQRAELRRRYRRVHVRLEDGEGLGRKVRHVHPATR